MFVECTCLSGADADALLFEAVHVGPTIQRAGCLDALMSHACFGRTKRHRVGRRGICEVCLFWPE